MTGRNAARVTQLCWRSALFPQELSPPRNVDGATIPRRGNAQVQPHPPDRIVRFGAFEIDLASAELRKSGLRVRIQEQPFEVLATLVARPNEIVSREELVARLWPTGTFVDYERSLNAAVARLRQVLNDSAETPKYVETVARRGYRFVAPVEVGSDADSRSSYRPSLLRETKAPAAPSVVSDNGGNAGAKRHVAGLMIAVAMLLVIAQQITRPSPPPRIVGYSQITHSGRAKAYLNNAHPIIVTDASRVYFVETANGLMRSALHQVSQSGGETSPVPIELPENVEIGDISPDGSRLLLQTSASPEPEMRLWTLPVGGGAPRRLGDLRGPDPTWSPDGQSIAYAKGDELYICKADGSGNKRVVSGPGQIIWPRWADGRVLRYTRVGTRIEEVSASGGNPRPLLPEWKGAHCCGNWTADGRYYLFQSTELGRSTDLWVIGERPGLFQRVPKPTRLTAGPIDFQSAVPSKDGTRLFAMGAKPRGELVRYDARTQQFMPNMGGISAVDIETTRDGSWCVYVSYPDGVQCRSPATRLDNGGEVDWPGI